MTILNPGEPAHAAAINRLQAEVIIWLTTVASSGQPQSTPVWFLWEAGEFLIYGAARGPKIRIPSVRPASTALRGRTPAISRALVSTVPCRSMIFANASTSSTSPRTPSPPAG